MELLASHDVALVRADNPGPFSLTGTNTWVVGRSPAWVIDPGPALDAHVAAVADEVERRGGLAGIALTHDHPDHTEAIPVLRERLGPAPLAAARGHVELPLRDGDHAGPLEAIATPGHAPDHLAYVLDGTIAFTGDAVLGIGSVFLAPDPHALSDYLAGLARLRAHDLTLICPGHGPLVEDPAAKIDEYVAHRLERERQLLAALEGGLRSIDGLLDAAWPDVPDVLRPAAAVTLAAHLDKLAEEGKLPWGVERPAWPVSPRG
jgi:glyoxylase-like metal-dependent hydrolase (beta-lactamase superfamily II)